MILALYMESRACTSFLQEAPAKTAVKPQVLINKGKAIEKAGISARKAAWESAESRLTPLARFERTNFITGLWASHLSSCRFNFDELRWVLGPCSWGPRRQASCLEKGANSARCPDKDKDLAVPENQSVYTQATNNGGRYTAEHQKTVFGNM